MGTPFCLMSALAEERVKLLHVHCNRAEVVSEFNRVLGREKQKNIYCDNKKRRGSLEERVLSLLLFKGSEILFEPNQKTLPI